MPSRAALQRFSTGSGNGSWNVDLNGEPLVVESVMSLGRSWYARIVRPFRGDGQEESETAAESRGGRPALRGRSKPRRLGVVDYWFPDLMNSKR